MATGSGDMNVALRVQADLQQARAELDDLRKKVEALGNAKPKGKALDDIGDSATRNTKKVNALAKAIGDATGAGIKRSDTFSGLGDGANVASKSVGKMVSTVAGVSGVFTAATAAGLGLAAVWLAGARESEAYAKALTLTGNAAGSTQGQLMQAARSAQQLTGAYGAATEATQRLAASGKVSNSVIAQAATASAAMAQVGAASVDAMVRSFEALGKAPVQASRQLNEQFHYLTQAVYEQIRALEEQGRADEAAALAQRSFAQAMTERATEVKGQLNALGRAWGWVGEQAARAWNAMKNIGRASTDEDALASAQAQVQYLQQKADARRSRGRASSDIDPQLEAAQRNLAQIQARVDAAQASAAAQADDARAQEAAAKATDAVAAANKAARTPVEKMAAALKEYRDQLADIRKVNPASALLDPAQVAKTEAAIRAQFATKKGGARAAKTDPAQTAYEQQLQQLQQARVQATQALTAAQDGQTTVQDKATARLDAWLQSNRAAQTLSAERVASLRAEAAEVDRLARATQELQEARERGQRIERGLGDVGDALAQAQGRAADVAVQRIEQRFAKLRADLATEGNFAGLVQVDQLIDIERAKAQLQDLQSTADRILGEQSRAEQALALQVSAGLVGELSARQKVLDLNSSTAQQIDALLPRMRELAALTGNPQLADGVAALELRVAGLRTQANELQLAFGDAFGNSMAGALSDLANGTATLGEAVRGFLNNLANGMAQWAAQQLAMRAQSGLLELFSQGAGAAAGAAGGAVAGAADAGQAAAAAAQTAATTAATAATVADTAATAAATASTAALTAAATAATVSLQALAAASASSGGSSLLGAAGKAFGFASGGYTGAGSKYQPAGIVHAGEFVNRQEVVRQPGALAFLAEFNRVGMAALARWPGYADGGLVVGGRALQGIPSAASYNPPSVVGGSTTVDNRLALNLIDDPARIAEVIGSPRGEQAFTVLLSRNPAKYRQLLGV